MVLFAQLDDQLESGRLLWPSLGAVPGRNEKDRVHLAAKMVGHDVEGTEGITERAGGFPRRPAIDEVGAQRFVLALPWQARFEKKPPNQTYVFGCSDTRQCNMVMACDLSIIFKSYEAH